MPNVDAGSEIAVVGLACRFPDANSPAELWDNALAQRRSFRALPAERLPAEDYFSPDPRTPDATYSVQAAVLEGYEFPRHRFQVAGSTFRSADLAHWLALNVAADALTDAGFADGHGLPRDATGVLLANTLTGEFSRAGLMRLRWPYVRRQVAAALEQQGWTADAVAAFTASLETRYKAPFEPVGEESLAGGLSNTIAGRICNHFDLKGGGYTVDGACASSLLALATACSSLVAGDLDVALAGGVDLSLDPFELVGFAKAGALAPREMRIYDIHSSGFWPGEGCGFAVLMRRADALARGARIYAIIRGWGLSSDGAGGITRPEEDGQLLALRRAYRRAGFDAAAPDYFEGHGTGTAVGDHTELRVLTRARREARHPARPAALGSVKANIGHTKAAAGIAGFIKATLAVYHQILPPTTGCLEPHGELTRPDATLRVLREPEPWPSSGPRRAGISSMGFGGINAHLTIESISPGSPAVLPPRVRLLGRGPQDAELFLLAARSREELMADADALFECAPRLSLGELGDLAACLSRRTHPSGDASPLPWRAALVASLPTELAAHLQTLRQWLAQGRHECMDHPGVLLSNRPNPPRIGFLFPGQASPDHKDGGIFRRRFETLADLYPDPPPAPPTAAQTGTEISQPAIVRATLAGLRLMQLMGVHADAGVGHSLGELCALSWAGVWNESSLLEVATARGHAMASLGDPNGAMAAVDAAAAVVTRWTAGTDVVVAAFNAPAQTVVSGPIPAIDALVQAAEKHGVRATRLPVSHAFHSPAMAPASGSFAGCLAGHPLLPLRRTVISTITGSALGPTSDLPALLVRQLQTPVRFTDAIRTLQQQCDLLIEVGPGSVLTRLVRTFNPGLPGEASAGNPLPPAFSIDAGSNSLRPLLIALGAAFVLGTPLRHAELFASRLLRDFRLPWQPRFLANPCESAPRLSSTPRPTPEDSVPSAPSAPSQPAPDDPADFSRSDASEVSSDSPLELFRQLVADRTELPRESILESSRLLGDLHLNSISIGQLVAEAARRLALRPPANLTEFAAATVGEVARALDDLRHVAAHAAPAPATVPDGVDSWLATFVVDWVDAPPPPSPPPSNPVRVDWKIFAAADLEPAGRLAHHLAQRQPEDSRHPDAPAPSPALPGVIVWLARESPEAAIPLLLAAARALLDRTGPARFVLIQPEGGAGGFARTLFLEAPRIHVLIVTTVVPPEDPRLLDWIRTEVAHVHGFREVRLEPDGTRRRPVLRPSLPGPQDPAPWLGPDDVLLVTGGGKGIAAECALALGLRWGTRLLLLGRSRPEQDPELAANLRRFADAGLVFRYHAADVTDAAAVRSAIADAGREWGPVTAFLHGAGANTPRLISQLDQTAFENTVRPKLTGFRNVLAAIQPDRLRLLVSFSSIIARGGLPGEADYAFANDWLTRLTTEFQRDHPGCRCLALEWSVWSGVGMGERLGRIESLRDQGISPIAPAEGVALLERLASSRPPAVALVLSGRFGELPTLPLDRPDLPFLRFLENVRIHYPGIELVVDVRLSVDSDPFVRDHVLHGERLFPAVLGLEAFAQVAMALTGSKTIPDFRQVDLRHPVVVPASGHTLIRLAALVRAPGLVEIALRCESTGFQADHFRAFCQFPTPGSPPPGTDGGPTACSDPRPPHPLRLDVPRQVYQPLLFHAGRFRRVQSYLVLQARRGEALLRAPDPDPWFGPYHPQDLVLGDPGARDAGIHAIQAGLPHRRLLPVAIDHVRRLPRSDSSLAPDRTPVRTRFVERSRHDNLYTYDLEFLDAAGQLLESWTGLQLKDIEPIALPTEWSPPLLAAYLERMVEAWFGGARPSIALTRDADARDTDRTSAALDAATGLPIRIAHRPDGSLELHGQSPGAPTLHASVSHHAGLTLAVVGRAPVGCDIEGCQPRSEDQWRDLLGQDGLRLAAVIAAASDEHADDVATRIWCAREALKKCGARPDAGLLFESAPAPGWVRFRSGAFGIATFRAHLEGHPAPVIAAIAATTVPD